MSPHEARSLAYLLSIGVPFSEFAVPVRPNICWFGLQSLPQDGQGKNFGDSFLGSPCVNLGAGQNQIGFARSAWV